MTNLGVALQLIYNNSMSEANSSI